MSQYKSMRIAISIGELQRLIMAGRYMFNTNKK